MMYKEMGWMDTNAVELQIRRDGRPKTRIATDYGFGSTYLVNAIANARRGQVMVKTINTVEAMLGVPKGTFRKEEPPTVTNDNTEQKDETIELIFTAIIELAKAQKELLFEVKQLHVTLQRGIKEHAAQLAGLRTGTDAQCKLLNKLLTDTHEQNCNSSKRMDDVENKLEEIRSEAKINNNYTHKTMETLGTIVSELCSTATEGVRA